MSGSDERKVEAVKQFIIDTVSDAFGIGDEGVGGAAVLVVAQGAGNGTSGGGGGRVCPKSKPATGPGRKKP